jgi:hypothetical protein
MIIVQYMCAFNNKLSLPFVKSFDKKLKKVPVEMVTISRKVLNKG